MAIQSSRLYIFYITDRSKAILLWWLLLFCPGVYFFVLLAPYVCYHIFCFVWKIAAHSAYDMFSWYKYLIVGLVFSHLWFWSGNLFFFFFFFFFFLLRLFLIVAYLYLSTDLGRVIPHPGPEEWHNTCIVDTASRYP